MVGPLAESVELDKLGSEVLGWKVHWKQVCNSHVQDYPFHTNTVTLIMPVELVTLSPSLKLM